MRTVTITDAVNTINACMHALRDEGFALHQQFSTVSTDGRCTNLIVDMLPADQPDLADNTVRMGVPAQVESDAVAAAIRTNTHASLDVVFYRNGTEPLLVCNADITVYNELGQAVSGDNVIPVAFPDTPVHKQHCSMEHLARAVATTMGAYIISY